MSLSDEEDKALQQRAVALIRPLIPANAEDRVARAFKQFNQIVRKHIRAETGLGLLDEDGKGNVAVRIVDGFPIAIATFATRAVITAARWSDGGVGADNAVHDACPS